MKVQVRNGLFETNSSSTHAINVYHNEHPYDIPAEIILELSDYIFDRAYNKHNSIKSKLAYLILSTNSEQDVTLIKSLLSAKGVENIIIYESDGFGGWVDHAECNGKLLTDLLSHPDLFYDFIFNPESHIITGDNCDDEFEHIEIDSNAKYNFLNG